MFEKEADYAETRMIVECDGKHAKFKKYKDGFKDGAEFGYNKANEYAKTIIQDLLDNSDEYARQRAIDFLEE